MLVPLVAALLASADPPAAWLQCYGQPWLRFEQAPGIDRLERVWRLCWDGPRLDAMAGEPR